MTEVEQRQQMNQAIIEEFRANEGKVGGTFEGAPMLLLHSTGAKSGAARINPMMYLELDGRLYVFGSNGGRDLDPGWVHNIRAEPRVEVELGTGRFAAEATVLAGEDRDRVYAEQSRRYPMFADYQAKVSRTIPVVAIGRES